MMDKKELRMYVFLAVGAWLLVDYLKVQAADLIQTQMQTQAAKDLAMSGGKAAGAGLGGGLMEGLAGLLAGTTNTPTY